jgi:diguanylate cyclase (GGDEF)-like protein/PAS domain S-box-containing protein
VRRTKRNVRATVLSYSGSSKVGVQTEIATWLAGTVVVLVILVIVAGLQIVRLTKRHTRSERALAASESLMRAVADNVPVRLAYFDTEFRFKFVNRTLAERFGVSREQFVGRTLSEASEEGKDVPFLPQLIGSISGDQQRFEYVDVDKRRGVVRHMETQLTPQFDESGKVLGVFGVGVDISHRKAAEQALRDLTEVFDATSDYVAQTDHKGRVLYINPAARRALGLSPEHSVKGRCYSEFFTPETNARWPGEIIPAVKRDGIWMGETAVVLQAGRIVPTNHMVLAHRDSEGYVARYSSIIRDISGAVAARHELSRQTATLNAIVDSMPALVAVCDLTAHVRLVNKAFENWCGRSREELVGAPLAVGIGPAEFRRSLPWVKRALAGETVMFEKTYPSAAAVRHVSITYIPMRLEDGRIDGFIGVAEDITRHREENLKLRVLSERCSLTGLLNRSGFESYLDDKLVRNEGGSLAVIYVDLDRFKPVNDTHGHAIGDEVLCEFGSRLSRLVRPTDAVARLGGDEFALALAGVRSKADAVRVAQKIVEMAQQPIRVGELQLNIGASAGVAFGTRSMGGWKELVARADAMAYRAKREGRGRAEHESAELVGLEEGAWLA